MRLWFSGWICAYHVQHTEFHFQEELKGKGGGKEEGRRRRGQVGEGNRREWERKGEKGRE